MYDCYKFLPKTVARTCLVYLSGVGKLGQMVIFIRICSYLKMLAVQASRVKSPWTFKKHFKVKTYLMLKLCCVSLTPFRPVLYICVYIFCISSNHFLILLARLIFPEPLTSMQENERTDERVC